MAQPSAPATWNAFALVPPPALDDDVGGVEVAPGEQRRAGAEAGAAGRMLRSKPQGRADFRKRRIEGRAARGLDRDGNAARAITLALLARGHDAYVNKSETKSQDLLPNRGRSEAVAKRGKAARHAIRVERGAGRRSGEGGV